MAQQYSNTEGNRPLHDILRIIECPICAEVFINPTVLPCTHTFCQRCIVVFTKNVGPDQRASCPLCRAEFDVQGDSGEHAFPRNLFVERLVEIERVTSNSALAMKQSACCEPCLKSKKTKGIPPTATSHCLRCDQDLCDHCRFGHVKHKIRGQDGDALIRCASKEEKADALVSNWLAEAPHQLKVEQKDFNRSITSVQSLINERSAQLKQLIDIHTSSLLHQLDEIQDSKTKEFHILANEIKKHSTNAIGSNSVNESPEKWCNEIKKVLNEPFSNNTIQFIPSVDRELLQSLAGMDGDNVIGRINEGNKGHRRCASEYAHSPVLLHSLETSDGPAVVGVTSLRKAFYLIRCLASSLDEHDAESFELKVHLPIPQLTNPQDITSCNRQHCLYVVDSYNNSIHRIELGVPQGSASGPSSVASTMSWSLGEDEPGTIFVSDQRCATGDSTTVLVTCLYAQKIYEFSAFGEVKRCIYLQSDFAHPHHALLGLDGQLIICHGYWSTDPLHRVAYVHTDGHTLYQCFGDAPGSDKNHLNQPMHMSIDSRGLILVADNENNRVRLLSPSLTLMRDLLSGSASELKSPHRLCLDEKNGRLYVVENVLHGRLLVFNLRD